MHDKTILKGLEDTWLQEGSNGLPLGGSIKKKSLKKMMYPAEISWK